MSATAEFYQHCADRGCFPLEADKPRPEWAQLRTFYVPLRTGRKMRVTGVPVGACLDWWNGDRPVPVPAGMIDFLECFCDCERCPCGTVAKRPYFANTLDGERVCLDCY